MEEDHLKDSGIDGKILLKLIFKKWVGGHGLAKNRDRWWAVVNAMMNPRIA
jgi:hypothetical protein